MRRKPRGRGREKFKAQQAATVPTDAQRLQDGRQYAKRLAPEQIAWIHECIARCRFLDLPIRPTLATEWEATWGSKFRESIYTFYCFDPGQADARRAALKEITDDPALRQYCEPVRVMKLLKSWTDESLEPIVIGYESVQVLRDGKWQHDVLPVRRRDAAAAAKFAELQVRLVERMLELRQPAGPARPAETGMFDAPGYGEEPSSLISPETRQLLLSEEGKPFRAAHPSAVRTPYEQHLAEMRHWNETGQRPSWVAEREVPGAEAQASLAHRSSEMDFTGALLADEENL